LVNDFTCACPAGYDGKTCSHEINECDASPCVNGSCTDLVNDYSCSCPTGYDGKTCSHNIDDCASNPCLNGGTCNDLVNGFTCDCAVGFIGTKCDAFDVISCKSIKAANPSAMDGDYVIDVDGGGPIDPLTVFCDMTTDGGGYASYPITGGVSTTRFDEANACTDLGLNMVIARTQAHLNALIAKYGTGSFLTVPGVYGKEAGHYEHCVMSSTDPTCGANWIALDGGAWFARNNTYGEPNGDYTPGCWLGSGGYDPNIGFYFNDAWCQYPTGSSYVCSDNAK
jgi:hypothetical protein